MKAFTSDLTKQGWSWAVWAWKACGAGGPVGNWGLYRPAGAFEAADPFHDSEFDLIRKIKNFRTENWMAPQENVKSLTVL